MAKNADSCIERQLLDHLNIFPDFPVPHSNFIDITPILEREPELFRTWVQQMCDPHRKCPPDVIACVESFGYVFGLPMAYELGCKIVLVRREGKLPGPTLRQLYSNGYDRHRCVEINRDGISPGSRVLIVDDVLSTGGTVGAAIRLVQRAGGVPYGVSCAIEIKSLHARDHLKQQGLNVFSVVSLSMEED
jgi:adenine phosphoribosyltransferase